MIADFNVYLTTGREKSPEGKQFIDIDPGFYLPIKNPKPGIIFEPDPGFIRKPEPQPEPWVRLPYYPWEPIQGPKPEPQPEPKEPLHLEDVRNPFIPPEIDYFGYIGKAIGKVVDKLLLKDKGASSIVNPSMSEISTVGGTKEAPDRIVMSDDSTGKTNTYVYRKVTPEEIAKGQLTTGEKISKDQFKAGKTYYVLVSAENGKASIKNDHVEIYALNYSEENGVSSYVLEQDEGMDGAGKSSINLEA